MSKVGIGVIGYGMIGDVHANVIRSIPTAYLAAIATRSEKKGPVIAEKYGCKHYTDYHEMLKDESVHAVAICLPTGSHRDAAVACAKAGKHIICEKPIDIDPIKAQEMIDVCKENNVKLAIIMQHRFDKPMLLLQKAIVDGRMGKLLWGAYQNHLVQGRGVFFCTGAGDLGCGRRRRTDDSGHSLR